VSKVRLWLAVALSMAVLLLAMAPARLLSWFVPGTQLVLESVSGTVWRGRASRALVSVGDGYFHLGALNWTLSPFTLLTFSPTVQLESSWGTQRLVGEVIYHGPHDLSITDLDASVPAAVLKHWLPLELTGNLILQAPSLVLEQGLLYEASGRIVWQDGGWESPQGPRRLGSYAMDFEQLAGGSLLGEVITLSGDVQAGGQVSITGKDYGVDVLIGGRGLADPQLRQALQLVAVPEGDRFRVRLEGAF